MSKTLRFFTCLIGLALLGGCTIAEPSYRQDLGGFAMIDEEEDTAVASHKRVNDDQSANS